MGAVIMCPHTPIFEKKSKALFHIIAPTATSIPHWNSTFVCVPSWPCQGRVRVKLRGHMPDGGKDPPRGPLPLTSGSPFAPSTFPGLGTAAKTCNPWGDPEAKS